jgi:hypothetical protein
MRASVSRENLVRTCAAPPKLFLRCRNLTHTAAHKLHADQAEIGDLIVLSHPHPEVVFRVGFSGFSAFIAAWDTRGVRGKAR